MAKIQLGISACLLGQEVRYNKGHKHSRLCAGPLAQVFEYQSWCPEMAVGLGVPREPIHMMLEGDEIRVRGEKNPEREVASELFNYGVQVAQANKHLRGYVLIKGSPSCALVSAKVFKNKHPLQGPQAGMFVRGMRSVLPLLPMEEEGRLHDPVLRENFVAAVYAYDDWLSNVAGDVSPKRLVEFHSRYKYVLMAHSQSSYRDLGRLVASTTKANLRLSAQSYFVLFMGCLAKPATRRGHVNVLQHLLGYLRAEVQAEIRQDILAKIDAYRLGQVNLAVPTALLNHYLKFNGSDYIRASAYLKPYAEELGLRNDI